MERQLLQQYCDEYTAGLLDGDELRQLGALIESGDPVVQDQLKDSEAFLAQLAWMAPQVEPPPLLRSKLLNSVRAASAAPAVVARPSRVWMVGWAVAAGLAVVSLYSLFALRAASGELRKVGNELAAVRADAARSRKVLAVVLSRDARYIRLSTAQNEPLFRAFWGGASGLVLSGANVPVPATGRTFQLWVVPKGGANPVSAGVFLPQVDGQVLMIAETSLRPGDAAALAISDEPAGGSAQPTTKPVYVGPVGD